MMTPSTLTRSVLMTVAFSLLYILTVLGLQCQRRSSLHFNYSLAVSHKAANHITGFCFSTLFLLATAYSLLVQDSFLGYCGVTTYSQLVLEELSFSYFLFDLIRLLLLEPRDYPWLLHHLISQLYTFTNMRAGVCGCGYIIAGAVHESTHPLRSLWHLARLAHHEAWYFTLSAVLTWSFVATRVFLIPVVDYDLIVRGFLPAAKEGREGRLSQLYATAWSTLAVCMLVLHWYWAWQLTQGYMKLRNRTQMERSKRK
jgi:hypothetical protein